MTFRRIDVGDDGVRDPCSGHRGAHPPRCWASPHSVHHRLHPYVCGVAAIRRAGAAHPQGVRPHRRATRLDHGSGGAQRLDLAPSHGNPGRSVGWSAGVLLDALAHRDSGLPDFDGEQLRHVAVLRISRRIRRQRLLSGNCVGLGLVAAASAGPGARHFRSRQRGGLGDQADRADAYRHGACGRSARWGDPGRVAVRGGVVFGAAGDHGVRAVVRGTEARSQARSRSADDRAAGTTEANAGVAFQPVLRRGVRGLRGAGRMAAQVLHGRL